MAAVVDWWHSTWLARAFTVGMGFTVMAKVAGVPVQVNPVPVNEGVTVILEVTGALVTLVAVKEEMLPVPLAAKPIAGFELTQL